MEKETKLIYCATPSRIAGKKDEVMDFVKNYKQAGLHPFNALPYNYFEGAFVGRDKSMEYCFRLVDICEEFWMFGVSDGTLQEFVHAKEENKFIRFFLDFDPEWQKIYQEKGKQYDWPLNRFLNPENLTKLEQISKGFEEYVYNEWRWFHSDYKADEKKGIRRSRMPTSIASMIVPTKQGIEKFCSDIKKYETFNFNDYYLNANIKSNLNLYFTLYLSALINSSYDNDFSFKFDNKIIFSHLGRKLVGKKINIEGDVGFSIGYQAKNSIIQIKGDVEEYFGEEAFNCYLECLDAGERVGENAINCKISVRDYKSLSSSIGNGTEIYVKGKKI